MQRKRKHFSCSPFSSISFSIPKVREECGVDGGGGNDGSGDGGDDGDA